MIPQTTSHPAASPARTSPGAALALAFLGALLAASIVLCRFSPRFVLFSAIDVPAAQAYPELARAGDAWRLVLDPDAPIVHSFDKALHGRTFFPLIARTLGLSRTAYLSIPFLGCLLALALAFHVLARETTGMTALAGSVLLGTCSWFLCSTGWLAYFDSWTTLGLLLATFGKQRAILALSSLVFPWIDERYLAALPLCLVLRQLLAPEPRLRELLLDGLACGVGVAPWLASRATTFSIAEDSVSGVSIARGLKRDRPDDVVARGIWHGLRLAWIPVVALVADVARRRRHGWTALALAALGAVLFSSVLLAGDFSRNMSAVVPAVAAGLLLAARDPRLRPRAAIPLLAALNLILPARHIVLFFEAPIPTLPAAIASLRHPPPELDPDALVRRGAERLARRNPGLAVVDLESALVLAPRRWDARLLLARALLAQGKGAEAHLQLEKILAQAPESWPGRSTAADMLAASRARMGATEPPR